MKYYRGCWVEWSFQPFYREWNWRRPLWSLNPICWAFVHSPSDSYSIVYEYHCTQEEAKAEESKFINREYSRWEQEQKEKRALAEQLKQLKSQEPIFLKVTT